MTPWRASTQLKYPSVLSWSSRAMIKRVSPWVFFRFEYKMPGLEAFSPERLFFLSFARVWCEKRSSKSLIEQTRKGARSHTRWRINGAVQNSAEFATAFGCSKGAPNPVKKCELW
ncbi:unnamed protein product [Mortierella alpina]